MSDWLELKGLLDRGDYGKAAEFLSTQPEDAEVTPVNLIMAVAVSLHVNFEIPFKWLNNALGSEHTTQLFDYLIKVYTKTNEATQARCAHILYQYAEAVRSSLPVNEDRLNKAISLRLRSLGMPSDILIRIGLAENLKRDLLIKDMGL